MSLFHWILTVVGFAVAGFQLFRAARKEVDLTGDELHAIAAYYSKRFRKQTRLQEVAWLFWHSASLRKWQRVGKDILAEYDQKFLGRRVSHVQ